MKGAHVGKVGFEAAQVRQVLSKLEQGHPPSSSAEHLFESVGRPHPGLVLDINSLTESFAEVESSGYIPTTGGFRQIYFGGSNMVS